MKTIKKIISMLLVVLMLLAVSSVVLAADVADMNDLPLPGMNDDSVIQAVERYFDARADYLLGYTDAMDWLVVGIANDETVHMAQYKAKGLVLSDTVYIIENVESYDTHAEVIAVETIFYINGGVPGTEDITHMLTLYLDSENVPVVAADGYAELCSGFNSCSYVAPIMRGLANTSVGGGSLCIIEIAKAELGTVEGVENLTKYGEWYGWNGVVWCAIFVSWCANQANVNTSIIEKTASCDVMMNAFRSQGNFYYSQNFGGSYIPQPGDILFVGTVINDSTHVGIVEKVENNQVWIYDGNYSDRVNYHSYSLSASNIIGYGHPAYESNGHAFTAYGLDQNRHWQECVVCGYAEEARHIEEGPYFCDERYHWQECALCGCAAEEEDHIAGSTYSYDGTYHWKQCRICGMAMNKTAHMRVLASDGTYKCKFCDCRIFSAIQSKSNDSLEV